MKRLFERLKLSLTKPALSGHKQITVKALGFLIAVLLTFPNFALGQKKSLVEFGTNFGVTIIDAGGSTLTNFAVPGQGFAGQPTIYASLFPGGIVIIEPQIALTVLHVEDETVTTLGFGVQMGCLFKGSEENSLFAVGNISSQSISSSDYSDSEFGFGGKLGYRILIGDGFGIRFEGGYRRWLEADLNEFMFGVGIGGIIKRNK